MWLLYREERAILKEVFVPKNDCTIVKRNAGFMMSSECNYVRAEERMIPGAIVIARLGRNQIWLPSRAELVNRCSRTVFASPAIGNTGWDSSRAS